MSQLNPAPVRPAAPAPVRQTLKAYRITYLVNSGMRGHWNLLARTPGEAKTSMEELLPQARVVSILRDDGEW